MALSSSPSRPVQIRYESNAFPTGTTPNIVSDLAVGWGDILWAALTIGRPNTHTVFAHGNASYHEAIFRIAMVRITIQQQGTRPPRLVRTPAFRRLDPTEKGAISYFLGMTFCGLFSERLLGAPWLIHLDVYGALVGALLSGRSRPDLIGQVASSGAWISFESKGRANLPSAPDKAKAKSQAQRIVSVSGAPCSLHVGAFTFFRKDKLEFYWRDPPAKGKAIEIADPSPGWRFHYASVVALLKSSGWNGSEDVEPKRIEQADIWVGVHPGIADALWKEDWDRAHIQAREMKQMIINDGFKADGLSVKAGDTWLEPRGDLDWEY